MEHSRNATLNDASGVRWVRQQCATSSPRPLLLSCYYFRVPRHMLLTVQHRYFWFHLRLFLWLLLLLFLRSTSLSLLLNASHPFYIRNKMQNVIYSCLMKASSIWSAVLCNYFKPWEKPQQLTCKITVVFFTRHSLTRHSPFVPLCRVDDWLTKWSLEDEVYKSNSFPIHVLSQAVLWVTSWKTS